MNRFDLAIGIQRVGRIFPSKAGMFGPTKRQTRRQNIKAVDPDIAGYQCFGHAVRALQIGCHHAGTETKFGTIGTLDGVLLIIKNQHRHDRAKNLFTRDAH